jgi:hypothetical protein
MLSWTLAAALALPDATPSQPAVPAGGAPPVAAVPAVGDPIAQDRPRGCRAIPADHVDLLTLSYDMPARDSAMHAAVNRPRELQAMPPEAINRRYCRRRRGSSTVRSPGRS